MFFQLMEPEWKLKQGLTYDMDFRALKHKIFVENLTFNSKASTVS